MDRRAPAPDDIDSPVYPLSPLRPVSGQRSKTRLPRPRGGGARGRVLEFVSVA